MVIILLFRKINNKIISVILIIVSKQFCINSLLKLAQLVTLNTFSTKLHFFHYCRVVLIRRVDHKLSIYVRIKMVFLTFLNFRFKQGGKFCIERYGT